MLESRTDSSHKNFRSLFVVAFAILFAVGVAASWPRSASNQEQIPSNLGRDGQQSEALAAIQVVDDDGLGNASDCDASDPTFSSIQAAVTAAAPNDTIKVCPGLYTENVTVNKSLTINGAQAGVDARGRVASESTISPAVPGTASINIAFSGTVTVDGFSFSAGTSLGVIQTTVGPNNNMQIVNNRFSGYTQSAIFMNRGGSDITISQNVLDGSSIAGSGQAIFANGPQSFTGLFITNNEIVNNTGRYGFFVDGNHNVGESATRAPQISGNLFNNNLQGLNLGSRSFGTLGTPVLGTYGGSILNNTFSNHSANGIQAGMQHVLVQGNTFTNNALSGLVLTSFGNLGVDRGAQNSTIIGNTFTGNGGGTADAVFFSSTQAAGTISTNHFNFNRVVGNNRGASYSGSETIDIENNWWGCNFGPGAGGTGCSGTTNPLGGTSPANLDANPWLILSSAAVPSTVLIGGTSVVTSKLTLNSNLVDTSSSGTVPDGINATFVGTLGSVLPPSNVTLSGITFTNYTASGTAGTGGVMTTIDGQTVDAPINILPACATVSIPNTITTHRNQVVTAPINVTDMTGRNAISYDFRLSYDPAILTSPVVSTAGTLSNGWTITVNANTPGVLIISGFNASPLTGTGVMLNISFTAIGPIGSNSDLIFDSFIFNEGDPCSATIKGLVNIVSGNITGAIRYANAASPPVPVPNVVLNSAGSVPATDTSDFGGLYTISDLGAGPYTVTPSKTGDVNGITGFDSALIAQHVVLLITLNATQLLAADVSQNGMATSFDAALIAQYIVLIPNVGITGTWKFTPVNRSYPDVENDFVNQDYDAILMGEVSGNWVAPTMRGTWRPTVPAGAPVIVTAPTSLTTPGSNVTIPVTVDDTTGLSIISYEFDLQFDPLVIQPQSPPVSATGTLSDGRLVTSNVVGGNLLKVVVFGTSNFVGGGTLINLRFTAVGTAGNVSPLTWTRFMFNEGTPTSVPVSGTVTLVGPTASGAALSGRLLSALGQGVPNSLVTVTDTLGVRRSVRSTPFGDYQIEGLTPGQTYVISVDNRRFVFTDRVVTISGDVVGFDLIAEP